VPRSFILLLLTAVFGGGYFYMGGTLPSQVAQYIQPSGPYANQNGQVGSNRPPSTAPNYFPAGQFSAPPAAQTPAILAGQTNNAPQRGGPTIRIASFNIQILGDDKASKPYIMQTLAQIVHNFQIVAIQEIRTKNDYLLDAFLRDYVNAGGGRYYDYVIGPRLGRSNSKEQYAFIYDASAVEVNRGRIYTVNDPQDLLHREPLVAMFRARGPAQHEAYTFVLVNIHTDPDETDEELDTLADVYHAVRQASGGEDDIIILGDINVDDRHLGRLGQIPGVRPVVTGVFTNTRQTKLYDSIIIHRPSTAEFTGRWGVYDVQRLHQLSPDQALQVSDHLPIWAEFSVYESAAPGRIAAGSGTSAPAISTAR
jgi:endonuclease/exonuclease/phosphatase family metal-dependent hydrolase